MDVQGRGMRPDMEAGELNARLSMDARQTFMRPELLNRIDDIVMFRKLEKEQLRDIVRLLLERTSKRLASREVSLEVTDAAVDRLAEVGYEPEYGARPLRRVIQREIDDRIADLFVAGDLADGGAVTVDATASGFIVRAAVEALAA